MQWKQEFVCPLPRGGGVGLIVSVSEELQLKVRRHMFPMETIPLTPIGQHCSLSGEGVPDIALQLGKMEGCQYFYTNSVQFSSVQSLSRVRLFATPWTAARQASLSITNSWTLLKLMSIESVMPSNSLILCRPILLHAFNLCTWRPINDYEHLKVSNLLSMYIMIQKVKLRESLEEYGCSLWTQTVLPAPSPKLPSVNLIGSYYSPWKRLYSIFTLSLHKTSINFLLPVLKYFFFSTLKLPCWNFKDSPVVQKSWNWVNGSLITSAEAFTKFMNFDHIFTSAFASFQTKETWFFLLTLKTLCPLHPDICSPSHQCCNHLLSIYLFIWIIKRRTHCTHSTL